MSRFDNNELKTTSGISKFKSGALREDDTNKPRFDLITPKNQAYDKTLLYRWAVHMSKGARKYSERNWEQVSTKEEIQRYRDGAFRHFFQFMCGELDEDHAAALCFNISGLIHLMEKLNCDIYGNDKEVESERD